MDEYDEYKAAYRAERSVNIYQLIVELESFSLSVNSPKKLTHSFDDVHQRLPVAVDATQGRLWCASPGMKPTEVDDRVWDELRNRDVPPAALFRELGWK